MEKEISISDLFDILKRNIGKIILCSFLGITIIGIYTFFFVTPQYQSTSKIVVNQTQQTGQAITNNDIQTNLNLINTYQSIIKEPIILEDVIRKTKIDLTTQHLSNKLSIQTGNNSLVFGVTVTDESPYIAAELANAVAITFQEKIGGILEVESVTILSEAIPILHPISPNIILNLGLGIFLGLTTGVGIVFLTEFIDKRVKDNKIIDEIGWTNLGSILEMSAEELKDTRIDGKVKINNTRTSSLQRRV